MEDSIKHIVKTSDQWKLGANQYKIIERGCLCIELCPDKTTKIKVGEGNKFYGDLPYIGGSDADLSNYYTKAEVDRITTNLNRMKIASVEEYNSEHDLPLRDNDLGDVRFVKNPDPQLSTDPIEYLWNGKKWIYLGGMLFDIDLSDYVKREEIMPRVETLERKAHTHHNKEILDSIEKPYTTKDKEKLDRLHNYDDTDVKNRITELENITDFKGATARKDGESGYVPKPKHGDQDKFLRGDGKWVDVVTDIPVATKDKLGGIKVGDGLSVDDSGTVDVNVGRGLSIDSKNKINVDRMVGATLDKNGSSGIVPAPQTTDVDKFLKGDGTWGLPEIAEIPIATEETLGGIIVGEGLSITEEGLLSVDAPIYDIYTEIVETAQFVRLDAKPEDWDEHWTRYFYINYVELESEPEHWNPTHHYKHNGMAYVPGEPGDTYSSTRWYDKLYVGLNSEDPHSFVLGKYYTATLDTLIDGESLVDALSKLNDAIIHINALEENVVYKNELADVAFTGDYDDLDDKPSINGKTIEGIRPSLYYDIIKTYIKTTAEWDETPLLVSEDKVLYIYSDYHVAEGIPGCKLGDGVSLLKDLPVFNPTCKVTDQDIENWNDKVGAIMSEIDTERLILYRNKGDVN